MLYLTYYEIDEKINPAELVKIGVKLGEIEGTEGAETVSWLITPDYWGIALMKVENEEAAFNIVNRWRIALPGVFKSYKGCVAMEVEKAIPVIAAQVEKLSKI